MVPLFNLFRSLSSTSSSPVSLASLLHAAKHRRPEVKVRGAFGRCRYVIAPPTTDPKFMSRGARMRRAMAMAQTQHLKMAA